jgi:hypothetical protein
MHRNTFLQGILIVFGLFSLLFSNTVQAQTIVPTPQELNFAKEYYQIYMSMQNADRVLVKQLEGTDIKSMSGLNTFMVKKYNYTKNAYDRLCGIKPPAKFVTPYNLLKEAITNHLYYVKNGLQIIKSGADSAKIAEHTANLQPIKNKYSKALTDFMTILKTWPKEYVEKVVK